MPTFSPAIVHLLTAFAPAFTRPTFDHALVLVCGTLLASGRRTVTAALRAVGLQDDQHFTTYHRVLNRAVWSALAVSKILLGLLITAFLAPEHPLVVAMDDHLERRYGDQVAGKGRYHDAVRSALRRPRTTTGIRWLCCAAIVPLPWSRRAWALPFLTIPAPSPAVSATLGKPHRTLPERAALLIRLLRRWLPDRAIVFLGEGHLWHRRAGSDLLAIARHLGRSDAVDGRALCPGSAAAEGQARRETEEGTTSPHSGPAPRQSEDALGDGGGALV